MEQKSQDAETDLGDLVASVSRMSKEAEEQGLPFFISKENILEYVVPDAIKGKDDRNQVALQSLSELRPRARIIELLLQLKPVSEDIGNPETAVKADSLIQSVNFSTAESEKRTAAFIKKAEELLDISRRGGKRPPKKKLTPNKELEIPKFSFHADPKLIPSLKLLPYIRLSIPTVLFFAYAQPEAPRRRR